MMREITKGSRDVLSFEYSATAPSENKGYDHAYGIKLLKCHIVCISTSMCALPWRRWSRSEVFEVTEGVRSSAKDSSSSSPGKISSVI